MIFSIICGLTVLIVLSSIVFAVQDVRAYCLNVQDEDPILIELDKSVLDNHEIRIGGSIFMLSEKKTIESLNKNLAESGVANVEIRQVERLFPNRVVIHYAKVEPYFYVIEGGQAYFYSNKNAMLMDIVAAADADKRGAVELKIGGSLDGKKSGSSAFSTKSEYDRQCADELVNAMERLFPYAELSSYLEFADVSIDGYIYVKTARGVYLEFSSLTNFFEQFRLGASIYKNYRESSDTAERVRSSTGTIILAQTKNGPTAVYSPANRYEQKKS